MTEKNLITSIKIPPGLLRMIDEDIKQNGDFRNRSEWILTAIRFYELERIKLISEKKTIFSDTDSRIED